jgi:antitoxin component YwqK of YwqJK toxin-antitoxin module
MYKNILLAIIISIQIVSCNNTEKPIPITTIECIYLADKNNVIYNGDLKFTGSCRTIFNFNGEYEFNGKVSEVRTYKKGLRHGVWAKYYTNGQLDYKGNCRKGYIHGKYTGYYDNGQLKEEGLMKKGYRDGKWVLYDMQGKLRRMELHQNKKLITYENY